MINISVILQFQKIAIMDEKFLDSQIFDFISLGSWQNLWDQISHHIKSLYAVHAIFISNLLFSFWNNNSWVNNQCFL